MTTLNHLSDTETNHKVNEAEAAIDEAIANPKPPKVSETPDYGRTFASKGKTERQTRIIEGSFKPNGVCEEPECSQPSTIELRYHRHGSEPNSRSLFHGNYCERHAKANARLMARFEHRPIDGQAELWVRPVPTWKVPTPKPKQSAQTKVAAAEVVAEAEQVKTDVEKGDGNGTGLLH